MTKPLLAPIDKLGLAITDAEYKWTPRMRREYESSVREHNRLTEKVSILLKALNEANIKISVAKSILSGEYPAKRSPMGFSKATKGKNT
jgi:hypothetical protein